MNQQLFLQSEPRGPSELVETAVGQNGLGKVPFDDNTQLRSTVDQRIVIKGMRLITAEVLTNGPTFGSVTAPVAELQKMVFVFYCEGWQKGHRIPALILNDMTTQGGAIPHRYSGTYFDNWVNVDWAKSYIEYANTTVSANAPYVVLLDVLYERFTAQGNLIKGPM